MSIVDTNRAMRGISLTDEDVSIFDGWVSYIGQYDAAIDDRNDYAVMLARTVLTEHGCRATCKRAMPA